MRLVLSLALTVLLLGVAAGQFTPEITKVDIVKFLAERPALKEELKKEIAAGKPAGNTAAPKGPAVPSGPRLVRPTRKPRLTRPTPVATTPEPPVAVPTETAPAAPADPEPVPEEKPAPARSNHRLNLRQRQRNARVFPRTR